MGLTPQQKKTHLSFWEKLADRAKVRGGHSFNVSPRRGYYTGRNVGIKSVDLNHVILLDRARVDLYIHHSGDDALENNRKVFDCLAAAKNAIESKFGGSLDWIAPEHNPHSNAGHVQHWIEVGGLDDNEKWLQICDKMIDAMIRLEKALRGTLTGCAGSEGKRGM